MSGDIAEVGTRSFEIWRIIEGDDCLCGVPQPAGYEPTCKHFWVCDFGVLNNPECDLRRPVEHLIVTVEECFERLIVKPGCSERLLPVRRGAGTVSVSMRDGRRFLHLHADDGRSWTWELFDAHIRGRTGRRRYLLGVWPD